MTNLKDPKPATHFHSGSTCPYCQGTVEEGQMIVVCDDCGSVHHDTCWRHGQGCSSYHCDDRVRMDQAKREPDLVITGAELENVVVPPKPARPSGRESARPYLPPKPEARSKLAVASLVLALAGTLGLAGVFGRNPALLTAGIALALASVVLGVIALVNINTRRRVYGTGLAAAGVLLSGGLIVLYFISLNAVTGADRVDRMASFRLEESRPTEEQLSRMDPAKAGALRTNVVIRTKEAGLSGDLIHGSGVIVNLSRHRAFILTNRHVIDAGRPDEGSASDPDITVLFYNGEESKAVVEWMPGVGIDLAILSCEALTLDQVKPAVLFDGTASQGDRVFAVGNPGNLFWSYTEGVISGIRIRTRGGEELEIYQTQTPINYGNSGGGLYDMAGRLIGINTWTMDKAVAEGLSFTISSRSVLSLAEEAGRSGLFLTTEGEPAKAEEEST